MDRSNTIKLISIAYDQDDIGQMKRTETPRTVYCDIRSITRAEWAAAGEQGLRPELEIVMFGPDYQGEKIVELDGVRYGVYRTFFGRDDSIELYLERKAGIVDAPPEPTPTPTPTPDPDPGEDENNGG